MLETRFSRVCMLETRTHDFEASGRVAVGSSDEDWLSLQAAALVLLSRYECVDLDFGARGVHARCEVSSVSFRVLLLPCAETKEFVADLFGFWASAGQVAVFGCSRRVLAS